MLAGELAIHRDHRAAFSAYEREMRPFVKKNQELVKLNQRKQTKFSQWKQIQSMRMLPYIPFGDRLLRAAMRPLTEASSSLTLRDYLRI